MKTIKVEIKGISPLLQHRFPDVGEQEKKSKKRTGSPDYSEDVYMALYCEKLTHDEDGKYVAEGIYQPASHIEGALIKAAVNFKISGKRGKTYKDLVKACVFVKPDAIALNEDWEIDKRPVVIQRARIIRARPKFEKWSLSFDIEIHDDQLAIEVLKEILDYAGTSVGIGDYRPRFGRFMVTKFKEV